MNLPAASLSFHSAFQFLVLKYSEEEDDYVEVISSDVVGMDSTYLGWATLPMTKDGESEEIELNEGKFRKGFQRQHKHMKQNKGWW